MALTPEVSFPSIFSQEPMPSKTYRLDIETGVISRRIDGMEAIDQFISKAISTIRYVFTIYSDEYGSEVLNLFGRGFSEHFIRSEIKRMITEAIIYDDRIEKVYDFFMKQDGDSMYVEFRVDTTEGTYTYKGVL